MPGQMFFSSDAVTAARLALGKFPSLKSLNAYPADQRAAIVLTLLHRDGKVGKDGLLDDTLASAIHTLLGSGVSRDAAVKLSKTVGGTLNGMGLKTTTGRGASASTVLTVPKDLQDLVEEYQDNQRRESGASRVATASLPARPSSPVGQSASSEPTSDKSAVGSMSVEELSPLDQMDRNSEVIAKLEGRRDALVVPLDEALALVQRLGAERARQVAAIVLEETDR